MRIFERDDKLFWLSSLLFPPLPKIAQLPWLQYRYCQTFGTVLNAFTFLCLVSPNQSYSSTKSMSENLGNGILPYTWLNTRNSNSPRMSTAC